MILECTGISAKWCPVCGDCTCVDEIDMARDENCPLHSDRSHHAAADDETDELGAALARAQAAELALQGESQRYEALKAAVLALFAEVDAYSRGRGSIIRIHNAETPLRKLVGDP